MKLNIVLIDDSSIELLHYTKQIERQAKDAEVMTFIRAKQALEYLKSLGECPNAETAFIPDIILVDLDMPEMNGIEFLNAFNGLKNEKFKNTKVYLMSATYSMLDVLDAHKLGATNGFFKKPLTQDGIMQIIVEQYAELNKIIKPLNR